MIYKESTEPHFILPLGCFNISRWWFDANLHLRVQDSRSRVRPSSDSHSFCMIGSHEMQDGRVRSLTIRIHCPPTELKRPQRDCGRLSCASPYQHTIRNLLLPHGSFLLVFLFSFPDRAIPQKLQHGTRSNYCCKHSSLRSTISQSALVVETGGINEVADGSGGFLLASHSGPLLA